MPFQSTFTVSRDALIEGTPGHELCRQTLLPSGLQGTMRFDATNKSIANRRLESHKNAECKACSRRQGNEAVPPVSSCQSVCSSTTESHSGGASLPGNMAVPHGAATNAQQGFQGGLLRFMAKHLARTAHKAGPTLKCHAPIRYIPQGKHVHSRTASLGCVLVCNLIAGCHCQTPASKMTARLFDGMTVCSWGCWWGQPPSMANLTTHDLE